MSNCLKNALVLKTYTTIDDARIMLAKKKKSEINGRVQRNEVNGS